MFEGSRVYVAGHRGLLGTALLKALDARGCRDVIARDRGELDLTDQRAVDDFFRAERPEHVFLAAGLTGGILANRTRPADFFHVNISMQDNVFQAAQRYGARHVVFYGSSCVYPRDCPQPMKEEHLLAGPVERTSEAYAAAKMAGLIACRAYNSQYGTRRFIALLPNTMYGPGDNFDLEGGHVLSSLIRRLHEAREAGSRSVALWGSGNPRRELVFSEDVALASIFAVENADRLENSHYNVGTGADCSVRELAEMTSGVVGFRGEVAWDTTKPDGAPRKLLDSSRFFALGWRPGVALEEGIRLTYRWYLENMVEVGRQGRV